jgi:hypothetical protein
VDGEVSGLQEDVLEVVDELAEAEIPDEELVQSDLIEDTVVDIPTTAQEIQELRVYVDSLPVMPIKQRRVLPYLITDLEVNTVSSVPAMSVPVIQSSVVVSMGQSNGVRRTYATII